MVHITYKHVEFDFRRKWNQSFDLFIIANSVTESWVLGSFFLETKNGLNKLDQTCFRGVTFCLSVLNGLELLSSLKSFICLNYLIIGNMIIDYRLFICTVLLCVVLYNLIFSWGVPESSLRSKSNSLYEVLETSIVDVISK
jgi:hypothetical protein